jgi:hypothetical protein
MKTVLVLVCCLAPLAGSACDECDQDDTKCDGEMILVCRSGEWKFLEHCAGPSDDFTCAPDCSEHYPEKPAVPCCIPGGLVPEV